MKTQKEEQAKRERLESLCHNEKWIRKRLCNGGCQKLVYYFKYQLFKNFTIRNGTRITDAFGTYQLEAKNWVDDLKHRTLATYRGVTTIEKY